MNLFGETLSRSDQDELLKVTHFKKSELHAWHKAFRMICPQGRFGNDDLRYLWTQLYFLDTLAHNEFGSVDFKEYMKILSVTTRGDSQERLKWLFRLYDKDNDGYITQTELYTYYVAAYKLTRPLSISEQVEDLPSKQLYEFFKLADKNNDGRVSWSEFQEAYTVKPDFFELMPKFQDRDVTRAEIEALRTSKHVHRRPVSAMSNRVAPDSSPNSRPILLQPRTSPSLPGQRSSPSSLPTPRSTRSSPSIPEHLRQNSLSPNINRSQYDEFSHYTLSISPPTPPQHQHQHQHQPRPPPAHSYNSSPSPKTLTRPHFAHPSPSRPASNWSTEANSIPQNYQTPSSQTYTNYTPDGLAIDLRSSNTTGIYQHGGNDMYICNSDT